MESAARSAAELKEKDEDTVADLVDGLCTLKKAQGKWTAQYDIVRRVPDGPLKLQKQAGIGKCNSECVAIQRACTAVLKNKEDTVVSALLGSKSLDVLQAKVCK